MPVITTEFPVLSKLPPSLYEDSFTLLPAGETALYLFHDKQWCANLPHMLGWAREIIHSLKSSWMSDLLQKTLKPDWLCGHAFQWDQAYNNYRVSGTDRMFSVKRLVELAQVTQTWIEAADIHTDQWGCARNEDWISRITEHVNSKASNPFIAETLKNKTPLEVHTMLANHGNALHHPSYAKKSP